MNISDASREVKDEQEKHDLEDLLFLENVFVIPLPKHLSTLKTEFSLTPGKQGGKDRKAETESVKESDKRTGLVVA